MKLTIIPSDKTVYVDGEALVDLTFSVPSDIHALQWAETKGWVEYATDSNGVKPQNQVLTELPDWALAAKVVWDTAKSNSVVVAAVAEQNQP